MRCLWVNLYICLPFSCFLLRFHEHLLIWTHVLVTENLANQTECNFCHSFVWKMQDFSTSFVSDTFSVHLLGCVCKDGRVLVCA